MKFGIGLIFAFGLLILLIVFRRRKSEAAVPATPQVKPSQPNPLTLPIPPAPIIDYTLVTAGYSPDMARWWTAVAKHETGNFTSKLFKEANNMFGMGVPKVRRSLRSGIWVGSDAGNIREFSKYDSVEDSAKDLVLYLQSMGYPVTFNSVADLVNFMKSKRYFEQDPALYLAGVKRYL